MHPAGVEAGKNSKNVIWEKNKFRLLLSMINLISVTILFRVSPILAWTVDVT